MGPGGPDMGSVGVREAPFRLGPHEVHVWTLRLDLPEAVHDRVAGVLSAAETARAERFVVAAARTRYAAARGLLRVILSGYVGRAPGDLTFEAGSGGKPALAGVRGPRFNLSHAGAMGLVAVSAGAEVGVDVEEIREAGDLAGLAEKCFSPAERAAFAAVPARLRRTAFFAGWTRKEAFLKVLGVGLTRPLESFDVSLAPGEPARLLRVDGVPDAPARYALRALEPAAGYVGAVAIEARGITIRHRPWRTLSALVNETLTARLEAAASGPALVAERES